MCWRNPSPTHTQQGLHSVEYQRAFKNYGENRYIHFVPSSSLREVNGRAPFNCLLGGGCSLEPFFVLWLIIQSTSEITHPAYSKAAQGTAYCTFTKIPWIWLGLKSSVLIGQVPGTLLPHRRYTAMLLLFALPGDKAQIISWGGGHYLKSRGLGCQPRSGNPMLGHLAKAKLGEPTYAWGFNAHTYTATIKDVWTDMEITQKLWTSLPEMSATGEPGSQHCS